MHACGSRAVGPPTRVTLALQTRMPDAAPHRSCHVTTRRQHAGTAYGWAGRVGMPLPGRLRGRRSARVRNYRIVVYTIEGLPERHSIRRPHRHGTALRKRDTLVACRLVYFLSVETRRRVPCRDLWFEARGAASVTERGYHIRPAAALSASEIARGLGKSQAT
jgi:hypothetical protein